MKNRSIWVFLLAISLVACGAEDPPVPTAVAGLPAAATPTTNPSSPTPTPTTVASPTATPPPIATVTATATPTPDPLAKYTIAALREREYQGGAIVVRSVLTTNEAYTRYYIAYPSDDLTITGVMHVPHGDGPFPVVILNHGYIPPERYWSGADTQGAADYLARRGFLTIAPDFRGWGESDSGDNFLRTGLVIDVLNLISSLPSLPEADPERVGMWGHSLGGGVINKAIVVDPRIKAAVSYAPVSADDLDNIRKWGASPGSADGALASLQQEAARDGAFLRKTSAVYHFDFVTAPVQIHQGTADDVTPPQWAEAIRDALLAAVKEVEYFEYVGEGHAFRGDQWWLFMERTTEFFDRHLRREL